ncbi:hypothetical protein [Jiangella ureilytica]|nr:hypothetical protein [Jiangella ureilytica]
MRSGPAPDPAPARRATWPPPREVYRVTPSAMFALGAEEPYGATRFAF